VCKEIIDVKLIWEDILMEETKQESIEQTTRSISTVGIILRVLIPVMIFLAIMFWAAGSWDWPRAWLFICVYGIAVIGVILWMKKHKPELLKERMNARKMDNVKGWDKVIVNAFSYVNLSLFIVAGLDAVRFGWSHVSMAWTIIGYISFVPAGVLIFLTMKENAYLSELVRIQDDRGHQVCTTGPYALVRHPMYVGIIIFLFSLPLALGSFYALIPAAISSLLLFLRTVKEDRVLQEELQGYREYASNVRYRLIPGFF
jgi:protein-S-isoprenylcysteine O-methyltransferase Ste14